MHQANQPSPILGDAFLRGRLPSRSGSRTGPATGGSGLLRLRATVPVGATAGPIEVQTLAGSATSTTSFTLIP
jgi:hypothetical protein